MNRIQCFWIESTDKVRRYLRRYKSSDIEKCSLVRGYHDAMVVLDEVPVEYNTWEDGRKYIKFDEPDLPHDDHRWPKQCECGYVFQDTDHWQVFKESLWKRPDTGEVFILKDAPAGAMWNAWWISDGAAPGSFCVGEDGISLYVKTPGGDWLVDGRASNCTMKEDNIHKCWVRHGTAPNITVAKSGNTCAAGAGSIQCGSYHGFLRGGYLEEC